jgi:hypothetical protein
VTASNPGSTEGRRKAHAKAREPERRRKIAAARRGKPLPRHVIEAMRQGRLGKPQSEETRRKISEGVRRRGAWPSAAGRPWTAEEDALLSLPTDDGRRPDGAQRRGGAGQAVRIEAASDRLLRERRGRGHGQGG